VPLQIALTRGHLVSDLAAIRHVLLDNLANYDKHTPAFDAVRAELVTATPGRDPTGDDLPRLPRLKAVIQETLRPYPPIWMFDRRALGPDDLAGTPVAKGDLVIFCPYALHRLPQLMERPRRLPARAVRGRQRGAEEHVCLSAVQRRPVILRLERAPLAAREPSRSGAAERAIGSAACGRTAAIPFVFLRLREWIAEHGQQMV